jgi:hypothetical protein
MAPDEKYMDFSLFCCGSTVSGACPWIVVRTRSARLPLFAEIAFDLQARGKFVLFYQFVVLDLPLGKKE